MAGNRDAFEQAMRVAANVAWDGDWESAIEAYEQALAEFPDDVDALTGLGMAYTNLGKPWKAKEPYERARELTPEDPVVAERLAEVLEDMGRVQDACEAYLASANQYVRQQDAARLAVACWEKAARVHPDSLEAHASLLKYCQEQGRIDDAVRECLELARIYEERERTDYAIRLCQHALKLSPRDSQALAALDSLRYGRRVPRQSDTTGAEQNTGPAGEEAAAVKLPDAETLDFAGSAADESSTQKGSPVEATRRRSLTDLAESVFEEQEASAPEAGRLGEKSVDALISKAIESQTGGRAEEAIERYQEVLEAGSDGPAVRFNLGLMYEESLRFEEAISEFERAIEHPDYELGSHFALGECHRARGHIDEALQHFIEVLRIVDVATVERQHADDLTGLYEHLAEGYLARGDPEEALDFANSLVSFLSQEGWQDKVRVARRRLDALSRSDHVVTLAEALAVPGSERILASIALSQEYARQDMHYTALEECYFALQKAPHYLPTHHQLADVSLAMGNVEHAVSKLIAIADTYHVRGTIRQAARLYGQALKLAPMDTAVRSKLIDILVGQGEIEQALNHHLILADSYYHLAQMDEAQRVYQEALGLTPRVDEERDWRVRILHKMGDIHMQRVDWRRALSVYEQIRDSAPSDERARVTLMELHYRLGQPRKAVGELDDLLRLYRDQDRYDRLFALLGDVVERWPDKIALRARLAQAHLDAGHTSEALEHLDKLGDLQLNAGQEPQARATIRAIVALQPPNVGEYEKLLEQIGGD